MPGVDAWAVEGRDVTAGAPLGDDETLRLYVRRLWATGWDSSPEDAVYDLARDIVEEEDDE